MRGKVGWADAIQQAFAQEADVIPPGWQTLDEVAREMGQTRFHVCKLLQRLVQAGKAETRKFRTWVKGSRDHRGPRRGYLRNNRHYRLIKAPKKT